MSIPAQGAEGAETMTAHDPVAILYTNWRGETAVRRIVPGSEHPGLGALWLGESEWHPGIQWLLAARDVEKDAHRVFALSGIKAWGQAAVDAALDTPAPRTDGGMTAGEARVGRSVPEHVYWRERPLFTAATPELAAEIVARLNATLAQPAGAVPESLRALSDLQFYIEDCQNGFAKVPGQRLAEWKALLSTHPAGRSAGSGADTVPPSLRTAFATYDLDPGNAAMHRHCERLSYEFVRKLLTAPDSTRTGDEGMEEAWNALQQIKATCHVTRLRTNSEENWKNAVVRIERGADAALAALATHPAAPEAQGAWSFDMEAAPRVHGAEVLGWGRLRKGAPIRAIMQWFDVEGDFNGKTGWWTVATLPFDPIAFQPLPAPPASSGQEG